MVVSTEGLWLSL